MSSVGRARERGETQGIMKVVVDAGKSLASQLTLINRKYPS
jgi:pyruvate/2-oxoglutarate dehydrogenase complex dihydrolipoamide dehydrogenase (E3) component